MKRPSIESQLFEALAFAAHKHRQQRPAHNWARPWKERRRNHGKHPNRSKDQTGSHRS